MPGMPGVRPVEFTFHNALTRWDVSPFALLVLAAVLGFGIWYLQSVWALSARGRSWGAGRTVSFLAGLVARRMSPCSHRWPRFTMEYFQAHVIQHLLLMVVGPTPAGHGGTDDPGPPDLERAGRSGCSAVLNSPTFQVLTHPLPVWFLYYFSMFAFFLTFALGFAMTHMWVMDLVNMAFLFGSTLFWWPLVGVDPIPHWKMSHGVRMVNLLIGVPIESFLALALLTATRPAASMYTLREHACGCGHPLDRRRAASPSSPWSRCSSSGCSPRSAREPGSTPSWIAGRVRPTRGVSRSR